jgi:C4-dicarboxylate-specific signal transduction histidine kinase
MLDNNNGHDALLGEDGLDASQTLKILFLGRKDSAIRHNLLAVKQTTIVSASPGETISAEQLSQVDIGIMEFRIAEFFEDLESAKSILQKRPLLPLIGINKNEDPELKIMALQNGLIDVMPVSTSPEVIMAQINSLGRLGQACKLMELQNEELLQSMKEIRDLEEQRQKNQATLVQNSKMAALGEMAGNLAHEINNPLAIMSGRVFQLQKVINTAPSPLAGAEEIIERIKVVIKRIAAITKGLKSFSRMGEKDPMERTTIASIIEDTLAFCSEGIKQLGIDLRVEPIDSSWSIDCRPTQISQVILNLLSNARDALESLDEKWIKVSCEAVLSADGKNFAHIRVMDSGKGLPPELVQKIYEPFFTTKPVNKGTGLGLSISKTILHEHQGELTLDQACPNTCFMIRIPIQ